MPRREGGFTPMEGLTRSERIAIDQQWQMHWYKHVGHLVRGMTVLDVGAGTGYGLPIMRAAGAAAVHGFDVVTISQDVPCADISHYDDASYDVVTAIDVIEHVPGDREFLRQLLRVARRFVFFSTPNWLVSKAQNHYHVREYTPVELRDLIASFGFNKPLGASWHDGVCDHKIWVSNHECAITTREAFDSNETWHNQAVLLMLGRRA